MNTKSYFVKLNPQGAYFFGGDTTFGEGETQEYLVHSQKLPQQSTIIGMLKKFILNKSGALKLRRRGEWISYKDKEQKVHSEEHILANELVEYKSENDSSQGGIIQSISPVFIYHENSLCFPIPKNYGIKLEKRAGKSSFFGKDVDFSPFLREYDAKKGFYDGYIDESGSIFGDDAIFMEVEQVGITKPPVRHSQKEQEEGYYKKTSYKLKDGFYFGFYVELLPHQKLEFSDMKDTVLLGGEKSLFSIEFKEYKHDYKEEITKKAKSVYRKLDIEPCTICLSDAQLTRDEMQKADFALISSKPIRHLENSTKNGVNRSKRYHHVERGSLFYGDKFSPSTKPNGIGLNYFIKIGEQ